MLPCWNTLCLCRPQWLTIPQAWNILSPHHTAQFHFWSPATLLEWNHQLWSSFWSMNTTFSWKYINYINKILRIMDTLALDWKTMKLPNHESASTWWNSAFRAHFKWLGCSVPPQQLLNSHKLSSYRFWALSTQNLGERVKCTNTFSKCERWSQFIIAILNFKICDNLTFALTALIWQQRPSSWACWYLQKVKPHIYKPDSECQHCKLNKNSF